MDGVQSWDACETSEGCEMTADRVADCIGRFTLESATRAGKPLRTGRGRSPPGERHLPGIVSTRRELAPPSGARILDPMTTGGRVDEILRAREPGALDQLMPVVYDELKRLAHHRLCASDPGATLSTTELVHEAFLKLAAGSSEWENRAHFFGAASHAMRQVLVDFARRRNADKRGGGLEHVSLGEGDVALDIELDEILAVDQALAELERVEPRLRTIVELRFFAGLGEREIAAMLGVSTRTIERDWIKARLVLLDALGRSAT